MNNNIITYMDWKPYEGGIRLQHLIKMDPQGMIPTMMANKASDRMTKNLSMIVDYLKNGTVPEPLF